VSIFVIFISSFLFSLSLAYLSVVSFFHITEGNTQLSTALSEIN